MSVLSIVKGAAGSLGTCVTSKAAPIIMQFSKHSPAILAVVGTGLIVGGVVKACTTTLKVDKMCEDLQAEIDDIDEKIDAVRDAQTNGVNVDYSDEDAARDKAAFRLKQMGKIAKEYAIPVAMVGLGIACFFGGQHILNKRNAALTLVAETAHKAFAAYRANVIGELGKEADTRFRTGAKKETVKVEEVDPETGKKKNVKKDILIMDPEQEMNSYLSFVFDSRFGQYSFDAQQNLMKLNFIQSTFGNTLKSKNWVSVLDIYHALGFDFNNDEYGQKTRAMLATIGWDRSKTDVNGNEIQIDFNLGELYIGDDMINPMYSIMLEPNAILYA